MAEEVVEAEESKPKSPILMIIVAGVVLLVLLVAAVAGTLFATGFFDSKDKKAAAAALAAMEASNKDGKGGDAAKDGPGGDAKGGKEGEGAGKPAAGASAPKPVSKTPAEMQRFEYRYHEMDKDMVANLTGSKKIMQVKVALMTRYDDRVIANIKKHEFALRSVALDVMRQTKAEDIDQPDFRKRLAEKIRDEMNTTLQKFEDFGGIEEIHFTNFIVQ
ncbi:MAG: flagellar basal body-associated FliL family protein [Rubrivivax sp.]